MESVHSEVGVEWDSPVAHDVSPAPGVRCLRPWGSRGYARVYEGMGCATSANSTKVLDFWWFNIQFSRAAGPQDQREFLGVCGLAEGI